MHTVGQRWADTDHSWHVAHWLHRALQHAYPHVTDDPREADVIFIAHYFLVANPKEKPLNFGGPLLRWHKALKRGPAHFFRNSTVLLQRSAPRPP